MAEQTQELRDEIQRLRDEQQRLRDEQEKLRRENGHSGNGAEKKQEDTKKDDDKKQDEKPQPKPPVLQRVRGFVAQHPLGMVLGAVALVLLLIGGALLLRYFNSYESTDDAEIDGHLNSLTPRIGGTITRVYVENTNYVKAGQSLVDIDPRDYRTALEQAQGAYAQSLAQLKAANPNVPITETSNQTTISTGEADVIAAQKAVDEAEQEYQARLAQIRQAEAQNVKALTDVKRYELLVVKEEVSREQYDTVVANAKSQTATVDSASALAEAARRAVEERRAQLMQAQSRLAEAQRNAPRQVAVRQADVSTREADVQAAKAQLDQAGLNLSYTKIVAPVDGVVSNRTAEVGQQVAAGAQLLQISQLDDIWVTANFKETQVRRMRAGQSVDIHVDAFDQTFPGYIESLPGSTGAVTSLLPPENATGNYVKVVQRLPVRIRFKKGVDPQHRLRLGMSVEPKVWLY